MKFYIILFLVSVNYIFCSADPCEHLQANSKSDCINYYDGVDSQGYHCCYAKEKYVVPLGMLFCNCIRNDIRNSFGI